MQNSLSNYSKLYSEEISPSPSCYIKYLFLCFLLLTYKAFQALINQRLITRSPFPFRSLIFISLLKQ